MVLHPRPSDLGTSCLCRKQTSSATHQVVREVEHKRREDPSSPVPPEYHVRGYNYGVQTVPLPLDVEKQSAYVPLKGMRLKGFVKREQVPRHHYLKDTCIVLPELQEASQLALSALARACMEKDKVAIVQCALRKGSAVFLGVLSPFVERDRHPDAFLMNVTPFLEDVRDFTFPSFTSKEQLFPSDEQLETLGQIVCGETPMEIDGDDTIPSDRAGNPRLHRFHGFLGKRSLEDLRQENLEALVFPDEHSLCCSHKLQTMLDTYVHLSKKPKTKKDD